VTVLTGFLGSGKTTLLNNILTGDHGHRIAVLENEFGEIDIDSDLVSVREDLDPNGEQIMMLNNGCICCTVRSDLVNLLTTLKTKKDKFDRILIETTGLANPGPIVQTFFLEPEVAEHMKLDGVLTLVDAKHVEQHLDEERPADIVNESVEQIAFADRIILNKTDLVSNDDLDRLEGRIKSINSLASIKRAERAKVDMDYVLGIGGFDLEKVDEEISKTSTDSHDHHHHHDHDDHHECGPDCQEHDHHHHHEHDHHHDHHHHGDAVSSVSITIKGNLDLDKVNYWLGGLLEIKSNDLYRMKGVLAIESFDRRFVFQGVHMMFEGMPDREWKPEEERISKMVFIGRDLDEGVIREGFEHCVVK
jgi:G3E family GTPase